MPRAGSVYSLPPGTSDFTPGTTILSGSIDTLTADLQSMFNTAWPVSLGGTGGTSAVTAWDAITAFGADIASASTLNLDTATSPFIRVSGVTTINAVTLTSGRVRWGKATGVFQLTASATLVVNGSTSANYTTTVGDLINFVSDGAAVYVYTQPAAASLTAASTTEQLTGTATNRYSTPDSVAALWEAGSDNTGGATITMGEGGYFNLITSTTSITAFAFTTDKAGRTAYIRFNTARTLTHNGTTLIIPGAANITTAAGDIAVIRSLGSGNFVVQDYIFADGRQVKAFTSTVLGLVPASGGGTTTFLRADGTFAAPASASMTLLETLTPGAVTNIATTASFTAYRKIYVEWDSVSTTSSSSANMTVEASTTGSAWGTALALGSPVTSAAQTWYGTIEVSGPRLAIDGSAIAISNRSLAGGSTISTVNLERDADAVLTNLRFAWTVGNFDGGATFRIYGIA